MFTVAVVLFSFWIQIHILKHSVKLFYSVKLSRVVVNKTLSFSPSGYHSQRLHGQISVQRPVWLDRPAHQPCTAQQERHGGICPCKKQTLQSHTVTLECSWDSSVTVYRYTRMNFIHCIVFLVLVHWRSGHFWLWGLSDQQLWAVLHQLCKWAAAVLLQPSHL